MQTRTLLKFFTNNISLFETENKVGIGMIALSCLSLLLSVGFMIYAAHLHFISHYAVETAFFYTGLCLFGLFLIFLLCSIAVRYYRLYKIKQIKDQASAAIVEYSQKAEQEVSKVADEKPVETLLAASLIGFLLGKRYF